MKKPNILSKKVISFLLTACSLTGLSPVPILTLESTVRAESALPVDDEGARIMRDLGVRAGLPADNATRRKLSPYGRDKLTFLPVAEVSVITDTQKLLYAHETPMEQDILSSSINFSGVAGLPSIMTASRQVAMDYEGNGKKDWVALYYYQKISNNEYKFAVLVFNPVTKVSREVYSVTYTESLICKYFEGVNNKDNLVCLTTGNFNGDEADDIVITTYSSLGNQLMVGISTLAGPKRQETGYWQCYLLQSIFPPANNYDLAVSLSSGDLTGDGLDDCAVTSSYFGASSVSVSQTDIYFGDPYNEWDVDWGLCFKKSMKFSGNTYTLAAGNAIGDIDGDGRKSLIIGGVTHPTARYGSGATSWKLPTPYNWKDSFDVYNYNSNNNTFELKSSASFNTSLRPDYDSASNLAVLRIDGPNKKGYVFKDNKIYKYGDSVWRVYKDLTSNASITSGTYKGIMAVAAEIDGSHKDSVIWKLPHTNGNNQIMAYSPGGTFCQVGESNQRNLSFATPNTDKDSILLELDSYSLKYSDPIILAALASSPYYKDMAEHDEAQYMESATTFTTSKGNGTGYETAKTATTGTYISISADVEVMGVTAASAEFEFESTNSLTNSIERSEEITETIGYTTNAGQDSFVIYSYPADVFKYKVYAPNTNGTDFIVDDTAYMYLNVPYAPVHAVVDAIKYTEVAEKYDLPTKDIASQVFTHTLGYPETYLHESDVLGLEDVYHPQSYVGTTFGLSSTTQQLEVTRETTTTTEWSSEVTFKGGGGAGTMIVGGLSGKEETYGRSYSTTASTTYETEMVNFPNSLEGLNYGFQWKMLRHIYRGSQSFPVLTYIVSNVNVPPALPEDVKIQSTEDTITLTWTDSQLSQAAKDATTGYEAKLIETNTTVIPIKDSNGIWSVTFGGLNYNEYFSVELTATNSADRSAPAVYRNIKTNRWGMGKIDFSDYIDAPINESTAVAEISVQADFANMASQTDCKWQWRDDSDENGGNFVDIPTDLGTPYVNSVAERTKIYKLTVPLGSDKSYYMREYRLHVTQHDGLNKFESYSNPVLIRSEWKYFVEIPYLNDYIEGGGWYYGGEHVTLSAPATIQTDYTFSRWGDIPGRISSVNSETVSFTMPDTDVECYPNYSVNNANAQTGLEIVAETDFLAPGESFQFQVNATGDNPLNSLHWYFNGYGYNSYSSEQTRLDSTGLLQIGADEKYPVIRIWAKAIGDYDIPINHMFTIYTGVTPPYNQTDLQKMQTFLLEFSGDRRNYEHLGWDVTNPKTWSGVNWRFDEETCEQILTAISWKSNSNAYAKLGGRLDLSDTNVERISITGTGITSADLSEATSLSELTLANNKITDINLSGCNRLVAANLKGITLEEQQVTELENIILSSLYSEERSYLYYGSGENSKLKVFYGSGRKIDIDVNGYPDMVFWRNSTDVTVSKENWRLMDTDLGSDIIMNDDVNNYYFSFTEPTADATAELNFWPLIHLPDNIFNSLLPRSNVPFAKSLPDTEYCSFDISWSNEDGTLLDVDSLPKDWTGYRLTIKMTPKENVADGLAIIGEPTDQYYDKIFGRMISGEYNSDTLTITANPATIIVPPVLTDSDMTFLNSDGIDIDPDTEAVEFSCSNSSGQAKISFGVRNNSGSQLWNKINLIDAPEGVTLSHGMSIIEPGESSFYDIYVDNMPAGIYPMMIQACFEYPGTAQQLLTKDLPFILSGTRGKIVSVYTGNNKIEGISYEVSQSANIMIGFYNGNRLVGIIRKPVTGSGFITESVGIPADADKIKIMMWNDKGNIKPLCDPLSIEKGDVWPTETTN